MGFRLSPGVPHPQRASLGARICALCGKNRYNKGTLCPLCDTKRRRMGAKIAAIAYLGGKCHDCDSVVSFSVFEFHHKDSSTKEFSFSAKSNHSWAILQKELDKCVLLCAGCHRIRHENIIDDNLLIYAKEYAEKCLLS